MAAAFTASYLEALEFQQVTARFDGLGRVSGLAMLGNRTDFDFDNYELLLCLAGLSFWLHQYRRPSTTATDPLHT